MGMLFVQLVYEQLAGILAGDEEEGHDVVQAERLGSEGSRRPVLVPRLHVGAT